MPQNIQADEINEKQIRLQLHYTEDQEDKEEKHQTTKDISDITHAQHARHQNAMLYMAYKQHKTMLHGNLKKRPCRGKSMKMLHSKPKK